MFFERVLLPHRSLPPRGFHLLMLLLGPCQPGASASASSRSAPGRSAAFSGSTSALLYIAFRLSYRSARQRETLRLADDEFTVERVGIYGERRRVAVSAVLAARRSCEERPDELNRLLAGIARQQPADRRLSRRRRCGASWPPRCARCSPLARRAQPGEQRWVVRARPSWHAAAHPSRRCAGGGRNKLAGRTASRHLPDPPLVHLDRNRIGRFPSIPAVSRWYSLSAPSSSQVV